MIRLPQVPGLQPVAIDAPSMRPAAAAAPAAALGQLAESIAGVSDQFFSTALHVQKLENARKVSEARQGLARDFAAHQLALESDPDPQSRMTKTAAFLSAYKGRMDDGSLPPAVRDELTQHFDSFATEATIRQAESSAKLAARRASLAMDNELQGAMDIGDTSGAHATLQRFAATGAILPEQAVAMLRKIDQQGAINTVQRQIAADPIAMEQTLEDPEYVAKNPLVAKAHEQLRIEAKTAVRERTLDTVATIHDAIASGYITDPAQVAEIGYGLRPALLAQLQDDVAKNFNNEEVERRKTPEYQNQVVGMITTALADYNPVADGYDTTYSKMDGAIRTLPEGSAVRVELERNIREARAGRLGEVADHAQAAMKALDEAAKDGRFGDLKAGGETKHKVARFLKDGFLRNPANASALGFGDLQAALIADPKGDAKALEAAGMDPQSAAEFAARFAKKGFVPDDNDRTDVFRVLYASRKNPDAVTASPFNQALARSLDNFETEVDWIDPEAQDRAITERDQARERLGQAKTSLAQWLKGNPKATQTEVEQQVFEIAGEEARKRLQGGYYQPRPTDGKSAALPSASNLLDMVKHFEAGGAPQGFFPVAYWDVKQWSIGYGTRSKAGESITKAEAEKRLDSELGKSRARVLAANEKYALALTENEVDALTSFDFNTGHLEQLLADGKRSKPEIAANMELYRNAGGQRMPGLERRRKAEQAVFVNGYPGKGKGPLVVRSSASGPPPRPGVDANSVFVNLTP